jgi:tRNA A37 threonylcarbamoyladenosine synthetase subunit TsaC/SUA5/YrdC
MTVLDVEADARRAFDILKSGGIAILPNDVGYSLIGGSTAALQRIFETKGRAPTKLNAMLGNADIHREVHVLDARRRDMVRAITEAHDLPLGLIAPTRVDHPLLRKLDAAAWRASSKDGTVCILMNAGRFHEAICRLSLAECHPLFGSSANRTMTGTKFRVEDIEPEIAAIADLVVDYGLRKYHLYKASSTLLDIAAMKVVRFGACYELIADVLARHFGIELPPSPREMRTP